MINIQYCFKDLLFIALRTNKQKTKFAVNKLLKSQVQVRVQVQVQVQVPSITALFCGPRKDVKIFLGGVR